MKTTIIIGFWVFLIGLASLHADSVFVANAGFEEFELPDGQWTRHPGCPGRTPTPDPVPFWTIVANCGAGTMNPSLQAFPCGSPEGENIAWTHGTIEQELEHRLEMATEYRLQVNVGSVCGGLVPGYRIQLLAGGVLLAQDDNSKTVRQCRFTESCVRYATAAADPIGERLTIRLVSFGIETQFDHVRLDTVSAGASLTCDDEPSFFVRGNVNADDSCVDISDTVFTLNWLFAGGEKPTCSDAADVNDDGKVDISDTIYSLSFLSSGGAQIPNPTTCGSDPTDDDLSCESFDGCQ